MKRRRNARLGVHLLWIVSSALVAGLLATEVAWEKSAPDGSARTKRSVPTPVVNVLAKLLPREAGGEEEQSLEMTKDLRTPLPLTLSWSPTSDHLRRPAWEEMFDPRTRKTVVAQPMMLLLLGGGSHTRWPSSRSTAASAARTSRRITRY